MRIGGAQLTLEQKQEAVFALCTRAGSAENVAKQYGVTREALYNWKSELLREEKTAVKPRKNGKQYPEDKNALLSEIEKLKGQIKRLQLEKDILEGTVDIIKKDPGADPKDLTNREKTVLVGALKDRHPLKELLACIGLARSSYFYHSKSISLPDGMNGCDSAWLCFFGKTRADTGTVGSMLCLPRKGHTFPRRLFGI